MYSHPDYKQGYEDAMDGKLMRDDPSSPYKADLVKVLHPDRVINPTDA